MNKAVFVAVLGAVVLLSGCSSRQGLKCPEPGAYADARIHAPYAVPEGVDRPSGVHRLKIPQGSDSVPAGLRGNEYQAADGSMRCLDQPPPMRTDVLQGL